MPALVNHRRELFTQLLFQGFSAVKAYEKAGYRRHDGNACTLAKHPEVQARLQEIRSGVEETRGEAETAFPAGTRAIAARAKVTAETCVQMQQNLYDEAVKSKQLSAGVSAAKEISILAGVRVERSEIGAPGEFESMSDEELLSSIRERWTRLQAEIQLDAEIDEEMRLASAPVEGDSQH